MTSLRQELKQFEQQFRSEHGRDPSKDDIKQRPDIAKKYRDYAKSKASPGKEAKKASSSSSSSRPLAAPSASASSSSNPFRTPTKTKTARQRAPVVSSTNDVDLSSETTAGPASPSRRLSGSKMRDSQSQSSAATTRYVLANSPSKIRALAALHSSTGSPNQPSHFPSSPQKRASNPFASPTKGAGSFAALEKAERERLKQRKKEEKARKAKLAGKGGGGVLGNKATAAGAGWGGAATLGERPFARTSSAASSAMEVDEVDEFFGAPASSFSSQRSVFSSQRSIVPATQADFDHAGLEDDDEVFGPSPVKPSSSLVSKKSFSLLPSIDDAPSSLPLFAPSSSQPGPSKPFKPLLPPAASPQPASQSSSRPVPFATALPFPSSLDTAGANGADGEKGDFWADTAKKEEEAKKAKGTRGGKRKKAGTAADDAPAPSKRKAPARRASGKGKGKAKAKASEEGEAGEMDHEVQDEGDGEVVSAQKGEIVIALSDEEQEGGGKARLIIHEKGWKARAGQKARHAGSKKERQDGGEEGDEMVVDVMQGEPGLDQDEENVDNTSLFTQRGRTNLLSTLAAAPSNRAPEEVDDQPDTSNLPADLAALLSLRSNSPRKSNQNGRHTLSSLAKEQQVARLLGEPIAGRRRKGGLLDLANEEQVGEAEGAEFEDGEGDDDWDEEVDGWEGTGEAMDGYYSGDGEVW
ncbi:hypothetical protein JCM10296v2_005867 [Rhodotorula toruloides]